MELQGQPSRASAPTSAPAPSSASAAALSNRAGASRASSGQLSGWNARNGALDWGSDARSPVRQANGISAGRQLPPADGSLTLHRQSPVNIQPSSARKATPAITPQPLQSPLSLKAHLEQLRSRQGNSQPAAADQTISTGASSIAAAAYQNGSVGVSSEPAAISFIPSTNFQYIARRRPFSPQVAGSEGIQNAEQATSKPQTAASGWDSPSDQSSASKANRECSIDSTGHEARPGLGLAAEAEDKFLRAQQLKLSAHPPIIYFDLETTGTHLLLPHQFR